jgi:predicted amidohydrolase
MLAAAIQMEATVADLPVNLEKARRLIDEAAEAGAEWIALPEFFTTGIGFVPELATAALAPDGAATELLLESAARHGVNIGGSFLCRDPDGEVRNAFLLATPDGIAGRHDKDLPTMWENSFYIGGNDDGVIEAGGLTVGAAVCWELMRTQSVRRLQGRVDLMIGGSGWWSTPAWPPAGMTRRIETRNAALARLAAESFSTFVGAPFIHAAHAGRLDCGTPWAPLAYHGYFQGGAVICEANGTVVARRDRTEGEGVAIGEIVPGRRVPLAQPPNGFWLHPRGAVLALTWHYQRVHGRRWYGRHVRGRSAATVASELAGLGS